MSRELTIDTFPIIILSMNNSYRKFIHLLYRSIKRSGILKAIGKPSRFPDEPREFTYCAFLKDSRRFSDGTNFSIAAFGFSFISKELALLKCLAEAIERFATICYENRFIKRALLGELNSEVLHPTLFTGNTTIGKKKLGWVKGYNLIKQTACFIPAQVIYLNYRDRKKEGTLTTPITTGTAGGFTHESTLLRGIYEVIERDAFMTVYLNQIKAPKIEIQSLRNKKIAEIAQKAKRYNLEVEIFNITHDLEIPVFLTLLIDRTGFGPAVSLGLKANLSFEVAIVGSMEESFLPRVSVRREMIKRAAHSFSFTPSQVTTHVIRGLFWATPAMLTHLDFLRKQKSVPIDLPPFGKNEKTALEIAVGVLRKKAIEAFYADITPPPFRKIGFYVYKVLMPQLQPMYLNEQKREWRVNRLQSVYEYFGYKNFSLTNLNTVPQPFI